MMRTRSLGRLAAAVPLTMVASLAAQTPAQAPARVTVRAENPLAMERRDEIVGVPWAAVRRALPGVAAARVRVLDATGRELTAQVVDDDGDGQDDVLLVQASFYAREAKALTVEAAAPTQKAVARVDARYDPPRDDMAWENDRVAFRIYGQGLWTNAQYEPLHSSGIDVWVKRTRALVVEKWYTKGHDQYHVDTGEGADFYDVGPTLGTGGTAVWARDTLWRAENFRSWKILADGPLRAVFELRYDPWVADGRTVSEVKRIAIDAGQNVYRQTSVFAADGAADIPYAIGIVKRPGMIGSESKAQPWAWLSGWGAIAPKNGGHGELGTAVLLPRDRVTDWKEAHNHYLAISRATPGQPVVHYIGAGWTASGDFPTPQSWWTYLDATAQRIAAPIAVTVGTSAASR